MRDPVGYQQGVELRLFAVVEGEEELAPVRPEALQRVRVPDREIPEIALGGVGDVGAALGVDRGDTAVAVGHKAPLGCLVPMQFPHSTRVEAHVHAGNGIGDLEVRLSDLTGPAAVLDAPRRVVERGPEQRKIADVGGGRGKGLWELPQSAEFCGPGSTALRGLPWVLTMPWGGSSGLPKLAAPARVAKTPMPTPRLR